MSTNWTPPPPPNAPQANIPNYLVIAILSIFCCWPLAIPAIIFAAQVNGKIATGDIAGAQESSKKAKMFSLIAIGLGVAMYIVIILLNILGALAGLSAR